MGLRPTLVQYAAAWSALLPPFAGLTVGRTLPAPRRWIIVWCVLLVLANATALVLARRGINNQWVGYVLLPLATAAILWALSFWHLGAARLGVRLAIPLVMAAGLGVTIGAENPRTFSQFVAPFHGMVVLLAALWTFLARSLDTDEPMLSQDWFWITGGLMLYAASSVALQPLARYLMRERLDLLHAAFNVKAAAWLISFAAITWGMRCPVAQKASGGSLSPRSLPPSSSSARSESRW